MEPSLGRIEISFRAICSWMIRKAGHCPQEPTLLRNLLANACSATRMIDGRKWRMNSSCLRFTNGSEMRAPGRQRIPLTP